MARGTLQDSNEKIRSDLSSQSSFLNSNLLNNVSSFTYEPVETDSSSVYSRGFLGMSNLEYRYKDKLRFEFEMRNLKSKPIYSQSILFFNSNVRGLEFAENKGMYDSRGKLGFSYFFPILSTLNLGLGLNIHDISQFTYHYEYNYISNRVFPSRNFDITENYNGFAPMISLEWKPVSGISFIWSADSIYLRSYRSKRVSIVENGRDDFYSISNLQNKIRGTFHKLAFIYRPYSFLGIHFGLVRENYRKLFGSAGFITTLYLNDDQYKLNNLIRDKVLQSNQYIHNLEFFYFQVELVFGD
jgi:hypothetical protein